MNIMNISGPNTLHCGIQLLTGLMLKTSMEV